MKLQIAALCLIPTLIFGYNSNELFPKTREEVIAYTDKTITTFEKAMADFKGVPPNKRTFDNTISAWTNMIELLWANVAELACLSNLVSDPTTLHKAQMELLLLRGKLEGACKDPEALQIIQQFALSKNAKNLTPSERYELNSLLATSGQSVSYENTLPYTHLEGTGKIKEGTAVTILNWNICFLPHGLPLLFGGVLPWKERIKEVIDTIKQSGADIICLQEVFSREANLKLYEDLKEKYRYFYTKVGLKPFGFDVQSLGLSSGLFIASNKELNNPSFIPFNKTSQYRSYGFFSASIDDCALLITTHLNPGDESEDIEYRKSQLNQIIEFANKAPLTFPIFLCGDLNINQASTEFTALIEPNFTVGYKGTDWTCLELRDYWGKANQNLEEFQKIKPAPETIDYFLQLKKSQSQPIIHSKLIIVNNPNAPQKAISDHQGMLTTISGCIK